MYDKNNVPIKLMKIFQWLVVAGFAISIIGLLTGIFVNRVYGVRLFFFGFILALAGIVMSNLTIRLPGSSKYHERGLRIGTIGFFLASMSLILGEFVAGTETISTALLLIGFAFMIWGIILIMSR